MGVFRVDPATLEPIPGTEPLMTGDWITGFSSPNGEWLGLEIWEEPDTSVFRVIEVATGEMVTEKQKGLWPVGVGDDGVVYSFSDLPYSGSRFRKLAHGAVKLETVFDDFPPDFSFWGRNVVLGTSGAAWLGRFGGALQDEVAGLVVVDLATGEATTHELPDLDLDADSTDSELVEAALVWDESRGRVLIVHGAETKVSTLDLASGDVSTHDWSSSTSWLGNLLAWLIPPAHAKGGPDPPKRRAALSPSGDRLYVVSSMSEDVATEGQRHTEGTPQGVEEIDTESWDLVHRWEIPASNVNLSPDGKYLVTTGLSWSESEADAQGEDVFVIDTAGHEILGRFEPPGTHPGIDFSPDGKYLYVRGSPDLGGESADGRIDIVDLTTMEVTSSAEGTLFGRAGLLVTHLP